jgi:hypothetical protein
LPKSQEVFSLRIAYLAFHLFKILLSGSQVNTNLIWERESRNDLLKDFGPSEWNEAMEELIISDPPLAQGVHPGWYTITDYGKEKSSADVLAELIRSQYLVNKHPVEAASKWQSRMNLASWTVFGCLILFLAIQPAYLPSGSVIPTFEPLPAKLLTVIALMSFVVAATASNQRNSFWFSNEQFIASAFYDAYLQYKKFIKDPHAHTSLAKTRELVAKAAARMQRTGRPRWDFLVEDLERISEIGKNVDGLLMPALNDHAGSTDTGELLILMARCFLERTRHSMMMAQSLRAKASPVESQVTGSWSGLSSFIGPSHPRISACLGGLMVASCILLVYEVSALISLEPIVPTSVAGSGLSAGLAIFLSLRRSRQSPS